MAKGFRTFGRTAAPRLWGEGAGYGESQLHLPISQPMAGLLSLVPGNAFRANVLNWLLLDGLYKAVTGRRKLLAEVNSALGGQATGIIKFPRPVAPAGAARVAEARNPIGHFGEDPFTGDPDRDPVQESDLFSPEAMERRPVLKTLQLQGSDGQWRPYLDHYDRYYEPTEMIVDYPAGMKNRLSLTAMRAEMKRLGMTPFRYGNLDGYIQFTEKGDWAPHYQRYMAWSANGQHGYDLRPDEEGKDEDGKPLGAADLSPDGRPTLHLASGSFTPDDKRAERIVGMLATNFAHVGDQVLQNADISEFPPDVVAAAQDLLRVHKDIKRVEVRSGDRGAGKWGPSRILFGEPLNRKGGDLDISDYEPETIELLKGAVKAGLATPFRNRDPKSFGVPDVFGAKLPPGAAEPTSGGWWKIEDGPKGGRLSFRLPEHYQELIYKAFFGNAARVATRLRLGEPNKPDGLMPELRARTRDIYVYLSEIIDRGVKKSPELAKAFRRVVFTAPKVDVKKFLRPLGSAYQPVDPRKPDSDPTLSALRLRGYRWEREPNWHKDNDAILRLGTDKLKVVRQPGVATDGSQDQFFLVLPTQEDGQPYKPGAYNEFGNAVLASTTKYGAHVRHGGGTAGHLPMSRPGRRTRDEIIERLAGGDFGEPYAAPLPQLRSVRDAATIAKNKFTLKKGVAPEQVQISDTDFLSWAVEGAETLCGARWFQIGYLSPSEIQDYRKWTPDKRAELFARGQGPEGLLDKAEVWDDEGNPDIEYWHILADRADELWKRNPVIDYEAFDPTARTIIGKNAFEARKYEIGKWVFDRAVKEAQYKIRSGKINLSAMNKEDKEGLLQSFEISADADRPTYGTDYWTDRAKWGRADDDFLDKQFGIAKPTADPLDVPPQQPAARFGDPIKPSLRTVGGHEQTPAAAPQSPLTAARQRALAALRATAGRQSPTTGQVAARMTQPAPAPAPTAPQSALSPARQRALAALRATSGAQLPAPAPQAAQPQSALNPARQRALAALRATREGLAGTLWPGALKLKEIGVVFDPREKPHDGGGWNWWGAPGKPGGVSVKGDADTAAQDPTGAKGVHKRVRKQRKQ